MNKPKLIVVAGTNASGKSALGVALAEKYNAEIISADSRQVFRGFDLGSGKITPENIARLYGLKVEDITDFASYDPGLGFKITYLRKTASGTVGDRDVYGAQQHAPLMNIEIPDEL